jgi:tetratricopeptide (TPR) repeat protein
MAIFLDLQQQARELLLKGKYSQLASLYEQEIASEPEIITHYWYLGLAYLLQGQEETAQTTWLMAIAQGSEQETEQWIVELEQILDVEAQRQSEIKNFQLSWLIRQHIREVSPHNLKNLLQLILLAIEIENFSPEQLTEWQVAVLLQQAPSDTVELSLLMQVLKKSFEFPSAEVFILTEASIKITPNISLIV